MCKCLVLFETSQCSVLSEVPDLRGNVSLRQALQSGKRVFLETLDKE